MKEISYRFRFCSTGIAFLLTLFSSAVSAQCYSHGCSGYVDEVYIEAYGGLWLQTSSDEQLLNCTVVNSGVFLYLLGNAEKFKEVYVLLLLAQATDKQVFVRIQEGSSPCRIDYVRLMRNQ
jgi:hypothetical protein